MQLKPVIIQNIFESLPLGLIVIDSQGEIVIANQAASRILGYPSEMFKGKGWGDLFIDRYKNIDFNQVLLDVIRERRINLHRSVSYSRPTGETLQLSITTSFLKEDEEIAGIVVLIDDVTEIHHLRLREKAALEEKNRLQQQRAEGLKNFSLAVAHQIRNPVASIGGFAMRGLKQLDENHSITVYLNHILGESGRLEAIVRAVNNYANIPPPALTKVSIARILKEAQTRLTQKAIALSKKINWTVRVDTSEATVDPVLFAQALDEVLLNSLESFDGDQGSIEMAVSVDRGRVHLEITDSGTGILEQDEPYIFDPFFTTKAVGVGTGLCKVEKIIVEHTGIVTVESRPEKGTKVTIQWPGGLQADPLSRPTPSIIPII